MPVIGCGLESFSGGSEGKKRTKLTVNILIILLLLVGIIKTLIKG